jgi:4-hydroxy-tetrahydrodipicolinate reductase
MKIGIIGYGKMGKIIEQIAIKRGHTVAAKVTRQSTIQEWSVLEGADVCIEFTRPKSAIQNYSWCIDRNLPIVTGTTGWYDDMDKVKTLVNEKGASFFWASNFSIGVNLFWQVNKRLTELMAEHGDYKPSMTEIHHTQKLDEPSGTAITTAHQIIEQSNNLSSWKLTKDNPGESDLPIEALRESDVKGTHIVKYESPIDTIELKHAAKTREGFALGAVIAAEFLADKKGFFGMDDLLG